MDATRTTSPTARIRVGDTEVARIGLGTNRLSHTPEHVAFIRDAVGAGIGMIDTAHIYAGGDSETTIGEALASSADGIVATKGGYADGRPEVLRAEVEESLRRLRTDSIALYYLHRPEQHTTLEESLAVLAEHRDAGRIRHVGISAVTVEQVRRAQRVVPIAAVQNHHNLRERGSEDVIDYCTEQGIAFVPYFPLRERHPDAAAIATRHGATESQVILAWMLRRSPVMLPIPGTLSLDHARENLGALELTLSDEEYETLQRVR